MDLLRLIFGLELKRLVRDRKFWVYGLVVYPILIPLLIVGLSSLSMVVSHGASTQPDADPDMSASSFALAASLADLPVSLPPGIKLVSAPSEPALWVLEHDPVLIHLESRPTGVNATVTSSPSASAKDLAAVNAFLQRLSSSLADYYFSEYGLDRDQVAQATTPLSVDYLTPQTGAPLSTILAVVLWYLVPWAAYIILDRVGTTAVLTDDTRGSLWPVASAASGRFSWLLGRYLALCVVATLVVAYYACAAFLWLSLYGLISDYLVAAGILEALSPDKALEVQRYSVDFVAQWRAFNGISYVLWSIVAATHIFALTAAVFLISLASSSVARANLWAQVPFMCLHFLPIIFFGAVGFGLVPSLIFWPAASVIAAGTELMLGNPNFGVIPALLANIAVAATFILLAYRSLTPRRLARMA